MWYESSGDILKDISKGVLKYPQKIHCKSDIKIRFIDIFVKHGHGDSIKIGEGEGILGIEEKNGELVVKNVHVYGCGKPFLITFLAFTLHSVIRVRGRGFTRDSHYYDHSSLLPKIKCLCLQFFHFFNPP